MHQSYCSLNEMLILAVGNRAVSYINSILQWRGQQSDCSPSQSYKRIRCVHGTQSGNRILKAILYNLDLLIAFCSLIIATHGLMLRRYPKHFDSWVPLSSPVKTYILRPAAGEESFQVSTHMMQDTLTLCATCFAWSSLLVLYQRRFQVETHSCPVLIAVVVTMMLVPATSIAADLLVIVLLPWLLMFAIVLGTLWGKPHGSRDQPDTNLHGQNEKASRP
ncbi:hypothetical protein BD289DRAFT_148548 [Coniella lustricola]|uniref:Uncharacterized protein n=1 Tax=Coniella lustricola TaxID=2025994 RepID=A0A2T2ZUT0_9PEZI|nr:hypothetical protein BD289DRAFT_148548 [Coniella lustricola]